MAGSSGRCRGHLASAEITTASTAACGDSFGDFGFPRPSPATAITATTCDDGFRDAAAAEPTPISAVQVAGHLLPAPSAAETSTHTAATTTCGDGLGDGTLA